MEWKNYCLSKEDELQKMFPSKNIKNPKTLTEKIQWLKIHDSTFLKSYCADKITLHDYCKAKLGKDICIPLLKVFNSVDDIQLEDLPNEFVLKCNHGCGFNIIVKDKKNENINLIKDKIKKWLKINYGDLTLELHYNNIPKKIFCEKYMSNDGKSLIDYKFWCFNGNVIFYGINADNGHGKIVYYNLDGSVSNIQKPDYKKEDSLIFSKPKNLDKMIEYSKILSNDFKLVRVDFYEINDIIYLGELTFTPGSGQFKFKNENDDLRLGKLLQL